MDQQHEELGAMIERTYQEIRRLRREIEDLKSRVIARTR
jgi:hypothetical protein